MTTDTHCTICKQQLRPGKNTTTLYHPHDSYAECIIALADRIETLENHVSDLEYNERQRERKSYD